MNAYRAKPNLVPWPPLLLVSLTLAAIVLHLFFPLQMAFTGIRILGGVLIAVALAVDLWAMKTLHDARTTIMPHRGSSHLVTHGPFGYSRNPIYAANIVLMVGMGCFAMNAWFLPLAALNGLLTHFLAVRREENHLIARFGYQFELYCRKVRRWI
ncbi:methyltransferase family protein [Hoeflea olei]|uniref:Isoprenylcysteine carboxyl methyltransferase n=1 Tax=Hoeflea olei TaxID=1480615 RepID=A0A1C1YTE3_9HYPH|nr:isoprenylcysteine carboxylmethyltransferase family protein [Hoeflea olei]OCW56610.1 hypothetical protein AWJ14_16860 [Hoeflea olei]